MSDSNATHENFSFALEVMIDRDRSKVLFAEADNHFVDILLSFLTLPLGRIVKILEKHYGDEAPVIGSLTALYDSLANLDPLYFCSEGAKLALLNPKSSFEHEYETLKLDVFDFQPAEFFVCRHTNVKFPSVSVYYDLCLNCGNACSCRMEKEVDEKGSGAASGDGVFAVNGVSFVISDDLKILPHTKGLLRIISNLGINETDGAETIRVTIGLNEIMSLLKSSLISQTPLSDLILNKTRQMNSLLVESILEGLPNHIFDEKDLKCKEMTLKVIIQKSTSKLLYVQAKEDFVELLFSFLNIPLGSVEYFFGGKTCNKALNNLYSTTEQMNEKYFKTPDMKTRLIEPNRPHGCVSENHILPLTEEILPADHYSDPSRFSSVKFPKGPGRYLECSRTYKVMDDLTVTPFRVASTISNLNELKIPISDIKEVQLQIGLEEVLCILKASLTSTSALSDGLLHYLQPNSFA